LASENYSYRHSSRNRITLTVVVVLALLLVLFFPSTTVKAWSLAEVLVFCGVAIALALASHHLAFPRLYEVSIDRDEVRWRQPRADWSRFQMSDIERIRLTCPDDPRMEVVLKDGTEVLAPPMCLGDVLGIAAFLESSPIGNRVENRLGKQVPQW
jgi:hypothetical protein